MQSQTEKEIEKIRKEFDAETRNFSSLMRYRDNQAISDKLSEGWFYPDEEEPKIINLYD